MFAKDVGILVHLVAFPCGGDLSLPIEPIL